MRKTSELKFNPIQFHSYSFDGSVGTKSPDETRQFSVQSQNGNGKHILWQKDFQLLKAPTEEQRKALTTLIVKE